LRKLSVALGNGVLDFQCATQGVYRTSKFDKGPITRSLDDASPMFRNFWLDEFAAVRLECGERAFLINAHQAGIPGNVGRKDGGKPPFDTRLTHRDSTDPSGFHIEFMERADVCLSSSNVRFGSLADICSAPNHVR
jgi:hypothetical protein